METFQKRDRERRKIEKRQDKLLRRKERAEIKKERGPGAAMADALDAVPEDVSYLDVDTAPPKQRSQESHS